MLIETGKKEKQISEAIFNYKTNAVVTFSMCMPQVSAVVSGFTHSQVSLSTGDQHPGRKSHVNRET
jgi:hypothetical protein